MSNPYQDQAQRRMREVALDVAADEVVTRGWRGLQMATVAAATQVSRKTLYKAFGDKQGLSQALILRHVERLLDEIELAMAAADTLADRWAAVVRTTLSAADTDPLVKVVVLSDASDEFLPLLTSKGAPVLATAGRRLAAAVTAAHPDLDPDRVAAAAEAVTRMTLSHLVLPLRPVEQVADEIGDIATSYLTGATVSHAGGAPGS